MKQKPFYPVKCATLYSKIHLIHQITHVYKNQFPAHVIIRPCIYIYIYIYMCVCVCLPNSSALARCDPKSIVKRRLTGSKLEFSWNHLTVYILLLDSIT